MSDVDDLVTKAQQQLDEHKEWLASAIDGILPPPGSSLVHRRRALADQARQITLRVVKASAQTVSVVWDYPDELYAFLRSEHAPKHLRDSLAGGHVVSPNQPASKLRRATPADEEPAP